MNTKVRILISTAVVAMAVVTYGLASAADTTIPTAANVTASTNEATAAPLTLLGSSNDINAGGSLTFATTTNPADGTLSAISGDSVTYTPNAGFTGQDSFQFITTEGATSSPAATATITVSAMPPTVTAQGLNASTNENQSVTIQLAGSSSDGSTTFTYATTSAPTNGTLGTISGDSVTYTPNANFAGADSFQYTATEATSSTTYTSAPATVSITVSVDTATITIRDGATTIGPVTVDLPAANAPDVNLTSTGSTTVHAIPARSVLALLSGIGATSTFAVTDLEYSYDFGEYYINCIAVPASEASPDCDDWTDAINASFPSTGIDQQLVSPNDAVYLLFNEPQWEVSVDNSSVTTGQSFTVTAQEYDPSTNSYAPASDVVVGAVQFDQNFNATEFDTATTNGSGQATLSLSTTGTYDVGVQSSGYFPNVAVTVSAQQNSGGGGAAQSGVTHTQLNIPNAVAYLAGKQNSDGSFDSILYTDWAALALQAGNGGTALQKIKSYELSATPTLSSATDYERHAMALEALGINPYSGTSVNYIQPILNDFDGTQIGDPSEDNDDIFALLALLPAGYTSNDSIIQKEVAFILSKQQPDGSWDESPDLTAAAIQALGPLLTDPQTAGQVLGGAAGYVASTEQSNGSWNNNVDSTSWVQTAINGIIQAQTPGFTTEAPWTSSGGFYPSDYIALAQQQDGGVQPTSDPVDTRVWSTSYAIVAASGQSWDSLLQQFAKPSTTSGAGAGGAGVAESATSTAATSSSATLPIATSTPAVATSTIPTFSATTTLTTTATTTATTTPPLKHVTTSKKKPVTHPKAPPVATTTPSTGSTDNAQVAAAASASGGGFFTNIWHAVTSFFDSVF